MEDPDCLALDSADLADGGSTTAPLLSRDELDFMQTLFAGEGPSEGPVTEVALSAASEILLDVLPGLGSLQVRAERSGFRYVFPLQSVSAPHPQLRVQSPRIYDLRGNTRSWRAPAAAGEIDLVDAAGALASMQVVNLSASGLLLSVNPDGRSFRRDAGFSASMKLPESTTPLQLRGRVVRRSLDRATGRQLVAVRFLALDHASEEAICAYLLRAHFARGGLPLTAANTGLEEV
jgi:hypothetical protein